MFRRKRVIAVVAVLVLIPIVAVAWWLVSPLFMNTTVEEEFPLAFAASVPPDMTLSGVEQVMAGMSKVDQEVNEAMPKPTDEQKPAGKANGAQFSDTMTDAMRDAMPQATVDAMSDAVMDAMSETTVDAMAKASLEAMPRDMPEATKKELAQAMPKMIKDATAQAIPGAMKDALSKAMKDAMAQSLPDAIKGAETTQQSPVKLKAGGFSGVDRFHKGSGNATIYRLPDGSHLLRLEDFKVTNGPDLRVILTPTRNPGGAGEVTVAGHVELAKLKGNMGNQNYVIPTDVDLTSLKSVVIFCKPFRVIFSVAPLQDIG